MFLGLGMTEGISVARFYEMFGIPLEQVLGSLEEEEGAKRMELLEEMGGYLRLTRRGISVSNPILADFLLD